MPFRHRHGQRISGTGNQVQEKRIVTETSTGAEKGQAKIPGHTSAAIDKPMAVFVLGLISGLLIVAGSVAVISFYPFGPYHEYGPGYMGMMGGYYGGFYGMKADEATSKGRDLLKEVSLEESINEKLRNYSQGMKKRFSLASAMLNDPQNYFFDETLNGLDPEGIRFMRRLMVDLKARGKAVLLSSHILSELENVADRIAIIHKGKIIELMDRKKIDDVIKTDGKLEEYFFKVIGG